MEASVKALIFDLDGVILSTDELHYQAWSVIARQEGIAFDRSINDRLRGISRMDSLDIMLSYSSREYALPEKQRLAEQKNNAYRKLLEDLEPSAVFEGVVDTLKALRRHGYKTAIASSSKNACFILEKVGLTHYFDAISDGNGLVHAKPDGEVYGRAAAMLGIPASQCGAIDDAMAGIQSAKNAGMIAFAIGPSCKSPLADYRLERITDLLKMLGVE